MKILPSEVAADLANGPELPHKQRLAKSIRHKTHDGQLIVDYLLSVVSNARESTKERIKAAELLMNRGWGRPSESVDITVQTGGKSELAEFTMDQLTALADKLMSVEGEYREVEADGETVVSALNGGPMVIGEDTILGEAERYVREEEPDSFPPSGGESELTS